VCLGVVQRGEVCVCVHVVVVPLDWRQVGGRLNAKFQVDRHEDIVMCETDIVMCETDIVLCETDIVLCETD